MVGTNELGLSNQYTCIISTCILKLETHGVLSQNIKFDELIHVDFIFPKGEHFIILIICCVFSKNWL